MKYIFVLLLLISCRTIVDSQKSNDIAKKEFRKNIEKVERYVNDEVKVEPTSEIVFLENLTQIHSVFIDGIDRLYIPTKENIIDWKKWYEKNNERLRWDKNNDKVYLKE